MQKAYSKPSIEGFVSFEASRTLHSGYLISTEILVNLLGFNNTFVQFCSLIRLYGKDSTSERKINRDQIWSNWIFRCPTFRHLPKHFASEDDRRQNAHLAASRKSEQMVFWHWARSCCSWRDTCLAKHGLYHAFAPQFGRFHQSRHQPHAAFCTMAR